MSTRDRTTRPSRRSFVRTALPRATGLALYTWRLEPHWLELELIEVNAHRAHIGSASAAEGSPEQASQRRIVIGEGPVSITALVVHHAGGCRSFPALMTATV